MMIVGSCRIRFSTLYFFTDKYNINTLRSFTRNYHLSLLSLFSLPLSLSIERSPSTESFRKILFLCGYVSKKDLETKVTGIVEKENKYKVKGDRRLKTVAEQGEGEEEDTGVLYLYLYVLLYKSL